MVKYTHMNKRIKSYLIDAASIFGTAFIAITVTPEWANFVSFANEKLLGLGVPAVVVILVGKLISEIWKQILNNRILKEARNTASAINQVSLDLY